MKRTAVVVGVLILGPCFSVGAVLAQTPTPTATPTLSIPQEAGGFNILNLIAPQWLHWLGPTSGFEIDPGMSGGSYNVQGEHWYSTLTVALGQTATVTNTTTTVSTPADIPIGGWIAKVSGTCNIAGTINASARFPGGAANNGGGSGGSGGGTSSTASSPANNINLSGGGGFSTVVLGGQASNSTGNNGGTPSMAAQNLLLDGGLLAYGECGGTGGSQGVGAGSGGGGNGGGCVVLDCYSLNFTGAINANGAAGGNATGSGNGGGGGGGGIVILAYVVATANSNAINVAGGTGGTGVNAGGNGGNGWTRTLSIQ